MTPRRMRTNLIPTSTKFHIHVDKGLVLAILTAVTSIASMIRMHICTTSNGLPHPSLSISIHMPKLFTVLRALCEQYLVLSVGQANDHSTFCRYYFSPHHHCHKLLTNLLGPASHKFRKYIW